MSAREKRVAIASCPDKMNFGSVLQSYATERAIANLGYEARTIDKTGLAKAIARGRRTYYAENLLNLGMYQEKAGLVGHRVRQRLDRSFGAQMAERRAAFSRFRATHFTLTPRCSTFEELAEYCKGCESVVVGSDQLWLPVNIAGGFYALAFVQPPARKIAYATSFGVSELPERYLVRTSEFLSDFSAVSVREESGAELVRKATGRACRVVCDPTMLLTAETWRTVSVPCPDAPEEPYALCYFLGRNVWNRECAAAYARERGLKIVAIAHPDEYVRFDEDYADVYPWSAGPAEWLSLVAGAAAVFTDSYHGTVFANLFEVPYVVFRRHEHAGAQSTNTRLDTLLNKLGCADRMCENRDRFRDIAGQDIDFGSVRERVASFQAASAAFLEAALAGADDFDGAPEEASAV